jgi:Amino acid synthesis
MSRDISVVVRKVAISIEDIEHDGGPRVSRLVRKGWIGVVLHNPFAGRYEPDIAPFMEALKPTGQMCAERLLAAMGGNAKAIEAYGKGALIGAAGEVEHGALWHVPGGYAMRNCLGEALAIVPSAAKVAGIGTAIDLPIHHKDACYVRSHFDAMTAVIPDAPRADELAFFITMSTGGRPHARVGGLRIDEISKRDGQR